MAATTIKSLKRTSLLLLLLLAASLPHSSAQPPLPNNKAAAASSDKTTSISPTLSILIVAFLCILFLIIFFFIYIRCCHTLGSTVTPASAIAPSRQQIRGLDPSLLQAFPTTSYSDVKGHKLGETPLECAVCLCEFEDHDILRFLPACSHVFHRDCVDVWLASHVTCPVCRRNLAADALPVGVDQEADLRDLVRIGSQRIRIRSESGMGVRSGSVSREDWEAAVAGGDGRFRLQLPEDVRKEMVEGGRRLRRSASLGGSRRKTSSVWRSLRLGQSARWPVLGRNMSAAVASGNGGGGGVKTEDDGAEELGNLA